MMGLVVMEWCKFKAFLRYQFNGFFGEMLEEIVFVNTRLRDINTLFYIKEYITPSKTFFEAFKSLNPLVTFKCTNIFDPF